MVVATFLLEGKGVLSSPGRLYNDVFEAREYVREQFVDWVEKQNILKDFNEVKGDTWVECAAKYKELTLMGGKVRADAEGKEWCVNEVYSHIANGMILLLYESENLGEFKAPVLV
jgi:hypothetical protein